MVCAHGCSNLVFSVWVIACITKHAYPGTMKPRLGRVVKNLIFSLFITANLYALIITLTVGLLGSAPLTSSNVIVAISPLIVARCSGVLPF